MREKHPAEAQKFQIRGSWAKRYGAHICFIYTIKYEFLAILKNQGTSHTNLYFKFSLKKIRGPHSSNGLKVSQSFRWESLRFRWGGLSSRPQSPPFPVIFQPNSLIFSACLVTAGIKLWLYSEKKSLWELKNLGSTPGSATNLYMS